MRVFAGFCDGASWGVGIGGRWRSLASSRVFYDGRLVVGGAHPTRCAAAHSVGGEQAQGEDDDGCGDDEQLEVQ